MDERDTIRMDPVRIGALIGSVFAFFVTGAIITVLWVAFGGVVGAGIGYLVTRYAHDARTYRDAIDLTEGRSKDELYAEAQRLEIEGRSTMTRDELAAAIASHRAH
jgi:hypothetical protein